MLKFFRLRLGGWKEEREKNGGYDTEMTGMEVAIVVVCVLFAVVMLAAIIVKGISMSKQMRAFKEELKQIEGSDKYLLDIVQNGKVVRIECKDVNSENVELMSDAGKGE